jgi:hypothetical protein
MLPFQSAYVAWVTLTELMIIASLVILLSLETNPRARLFFIPLFTGVVFFRPTLLTLIQGQVSGLCLFVLVWIALLWKKGKWFWGGILLGLLALRPNLGIIIIVLMAIWLLLNKNWRALCGSLVSGIFTLVAGLIYNPGWVVQYLHIGSNKLTETAGSYPTVWELGGLISHQNTSISLIIGGLAGLIILFGFFWAILLARTTMRPMSVLALTICVTLLVTPYTWTYDQVLLVLPLCAVMLAMDRKGMRFSLAIWVFLAIDAFCVILLLPDSLLQVETLNVLVPAAVFGLCLQWLIRGDSAKYQEEQTELRPEVRRD